MNVVIIKYNAGNIQSVTSALQRLGIEPVLSADPETIRRADKVIFPGVGEAFNTMKYLREHKLDEVIVSLKQPVLGVCLGLQLMCKHSEEGDTTCLGIFDEEVKKFIPEQGMQNIQKVPHMGWNTITHLKTSLFDTSLENQYVYFVHSYFASIGSHTAALTHYIRPFSASLQKDNFYATQFHPEKSGTVGAQILRNFIQL